MSTLQFNIGDKVTYQTLDEEYYSRGYGCIMETKTSQIVEVYYKLANHEIVAQSKLQKVVPKQPTAAVAGVATPKNLPDTYEILGGHSVPSAGSS
jgi:hypothetical protein